MAATTQTRLHEKLNIAVTYSAANTEPITNFLEFIIKQNMTTAEIPAPIGEQRSNTIAVAIVDSNNIPSTNDEVTPGEIPEKYMIDDIEYIQKIMCDYGCCTKYVAESGQIHGLVHYKFVDHEQQFLYRHGDIIQNCIIKSNEKLQIQCHYNNSKLYLRDNKIVCDMRITTDYTTNAVDIYDNADKLLGKYIRREDYAIIECYNFDITSDNLNIITDICSKVSFDDKNGKCILTGEILVDKFTENNLLKATMFITGLNPMKHTFE